MVGDADRLRVVSKVFLKFWSALINSGQPCRSRALEPKGAVVLPFQQPVGALIHLQSVLAIEVGRQAGRDLTSETMQPRKAV